MSTFDESADGPPSGEEVVRLGNILYETQIREAVEPNHFGEFIAIHVDEGDYRIARSAVAAIREMRKTHPADGRLFIRRIGNEPEYEMAARILAGEQYAQANK